VNKKTTIVGQGYAGLPVAMRAVEVGSNVIVLECDKTRVDQLGQGQYFDIRNCLPAGRAQVM
jgi:UDP-N-acetyl-D-glucosamine dehydrogenase